MKFNELKKIVKKPLFTKNELQLLGKMPYLYQFTSWQNKELIEQLGNGVYVFDDKKSELRKEEIAFVLRQPSYISLESALSFYGLIPEIVPTLTCVTAKSSRKYQNSFGSFMYRHIKPSLFFGYNPVETKYMKNLMAEPEKALLDYLYFNLGKINDEGDVSELRINGETLKKIINKKKMSAYLKNFGIKKLKKIYKILEGLC
jgi:hypothetical protein